ncbi:putative transposable element, partial [Pseudoloma neurophilia]
LATKPKKTFIIYTDASQLGIGAALCKLENNEIRLVLWISRKFLPREKNYTTTEKECLSVVWAVNKFRQFLHKKFIIRNDHQALKWLLSQKEPKERLARWIMQLNTYHFEFEHIEGHKNVVADALSRGVVKMYKMETKEMNDILSQDDKQKLIFEAHIATGHGGRDAMSIF